MIITATALAETHTDPHGLRLPVGCVPGAELTLED
ncbi:hypothetical protein J2S89_000413 [Arthrobacter bambusae]|nr:hypothetical protein [Arthrobacter bambusae]MDQ0096601.1 hypothetical protein [Arthrobacter bambusae]